jgi:hypothetical protein
MKKRQERRRGEGIAWLVADRMSESVDCYWYAGASGGQLVEQASADTAVDAVAWGRLRTPRVRIRTRDGQTQWAGTAPRPETYAVTWQSDPVTAATDVS